MYTYTLLECANTSPFAYFIALFLMLCFLDITNGGLKCYFNENILELNCKLKLNECNS